MDVQRKVSSLLVQWVRRFLSSYANWSYFLLSGFSPFSTALCSMFFHDPLPSVLLPCLRFISRFCFPGAVSTVPSQFLAPVWLWALRHLSIPCWQRACLLSPATPTCCLLICPHRTELLNFVPGLVTSSGRPPGSRCLSFR